MIDFAVEAGDLARGLSLIKGCVPSKTTLPILQCFLLTASAGKVSIFGSSIDMEAEIEVAADVGQDGVVAVHGGLLTEIAKKLPKTATVMLAPDDDVDIMKLACGRTRFRLSTAESEAMPRMNLDDMVSITLRSAALKWLLEVAGPCAADNGENQWAMAGVNLSVDDGKLFGIGYDGKRAAIVEVALDEVPKCPVPSVTIPNFAVKQITQMCREAETIELRLSKTGIEVKAGTAAVFRTRLIDAPYEAVSRAFHLKSETPVFAVQASLLAEVAERLSVTFETMPSGVSLVAAVGITHGLEPTELHIAAGGRGGVNEATDVITASQVGRFPEMALVTRHLVPAMELFGDKTVELRQDTPGALVQITSPDVPGLRYFLAPMTRR